MYSVWSDPLIWLLFVGIGGLVIGYLLSQSTVKTQIHAAKENAKTEFEEEKMLLSQDLAKELIKVRAGLIDTISAYRDAVQLVAERLPMPPQLKEISDIDAESVTPQLELQFNRTEKAALDNDAAPDAPKGSLVDEQSDQRPEFLN